MRPDVDVVAALAGVTHRYGKRTALDDVTLELPAGRMVGLIGPDGVGKSTLLALVAGVRRIQVGRVSALGGDMAEAGHRKAVCARIAYMPQGLGHNLYPTLSVKENVDFFGRLYGHDEAERAWRIAELLEATGLSPFPDRPAGQLSGGMKQKLSLCCALIHDPDLLILDEPTTGVDPLSRKQFWELIGRMRGRRPGMSVITATAYMEEAERFDHLIALDAGKVLAWGTSAEMRRGRASLEESFIAMLPEERRRGHNPVVLRPMPEDGRETAIEAEGLTQRFGDFIAVDRVTLRVERGEIFGFLGSNGCGKTTTMKMLTGLLPPTEGQALLFGRPVVAGDLATRRRVGYMSQSFSLYSELTVRQNLDLHARLFGLAEELVGSRVGEMLARFELAEVADAAPASLPLGVRQRLQLAVAVVHGPEMLILDEPTSGVDPIARDRFWELLIGLSRDDGVTVFLSTHFINEAERCDRISLMHGGRILAMGRPEEIKQGRGAQSLEEAFIGHLEDAEALDSARVGGRAAAPGRAGAATQSGETKKPAASGRREWLLDPGRLWAFARREAMELVRDPIRIAFALIGPLILSVAMSFGISFDIEDVTYAALDGDRSQESQQFLDNFASSRYFAQRGQVRTFEELDRRLVAGEIKVGLVIPPEFGKLLLSGRTPEVGVWLDGSNTFRAETARGYVQGVLASYVTDLARREMGTVPAFSAADVNVRFLYNQAFLSRYAISPGVIMMLIIMFSSMLTALGVVREKELGSITNLYAAPATKLEFLIGKQLPYVVIACTTFVSLMVLARFGFGVPIAGSVATLVLGALAYAFAATAFGLVISCFVRSQIAAIFGSAIVVSIPAINFSGMMYPVSTIEGGGRVIGQLFPALYFQRISSGVINKGLGLPALYWNHLILIGFCVAFWALAAAMLDKQER